MLAGAWLQECAIVVTSSGSRAALVMLRSGWGVLRTMIIAGLASTSLLEQDASSILL